MTKQEQQINYWANMLNESTDNDHIISDGYRKYIMPADNTEYTVSDLLYAADNVFPGQQSIVINIGPGGKIWGQANKFEIIDGTKICEISLSIYRNGQAGDFSTSDNAALSLPEATSILKSMPRDAVLKIKAKYNGRIMRYDVKNIEISPSDGFYIRPDEEKYEVLKDDRMDFIKSIRRQNNEIAETDKTEQLDERRMAGPAAARNGGIDEIADMRAKLDNGVVEFEFWKHDPEGGPDVIRHAVGTTSETVVPTSERRRLDPNYDENLASYRRRENFIIWFWDLEKNAVRCFNTNRFERIINVQENPGHVAPNVERIGDIFIHRDEDQNTAPVELTPDVEERINDEIENNTESATKALADIAFGDQNAAAFNPGFGIARAANGDPILKIIINKQNCTDNDAPYELKLNELRQEIRRRWNIDVKRAEVTGIFRFV